MTDAKPPSGLLLVMIDVDPAHEEEFNRWYDEEHLPERLACPGFLSGRRFVAVEGSPRYLALYDLASPEVLESAPYKKIQPRSPWTQRVAPHFRRAVRNVYVEMPAAGRREVGGTVMEGKALLLVMTDIDPSVEVEFNRWYDEEHVPERLSLPGFLSARRFRAVEGAPRYLALYHLASAEALRTPEYAHRRGEGQTAWTRRMEAHFKNFVRNVYVGFGEGPAPRAAARRG